MIKQTINSLLEKSLMEKGIQFSEFIVNDNLNLLSSGLFDSIDFLELIKSLETELNFEVDFSEHSPEDFTNYGKLVKIIDMAISKE